MRLLLGIALLLLLAVPTAGIEEQARLGPVQVTVRLTPDAPVIGDRLQLEIEVRAEPEVEVLMPEFGEALDRFEILDFVPRQSLDENGLTLLTQRYTLQAPISGEHTLPSLLIEFVDRRPGREPAPEGQAAYELLTEPLTLEVASLVPDAAAAELSAPAGRLGARVVAGRFPWVWLAVAAALLLGAAPFAWRAIVAWRTRARRRGAYDIAQSELADLRMVRRSTDAEIDAFFVLLSGIVRRYLENRFGVRSPEYTTEEFLERISGSPDLTRGHQRMLRGFLEQADLVKFAHQMPSPAAIDEALGNAERFIEETRETLDRSAVSFPDVVSAPPPSPGGSSSPSDPSQERAA